MGTALELQSDLFLPCAYQGTSSMAFTISWLHMQRGVAAGQSICLDLCGRPTRLSRIMRQIAAHPPEATRCDVLRGPMCQNMRLATIPLPPSPDLGPPDVVPMPFLSLTSNDQGLCLPANTIVGENVGPVIDVPVVDAAFASSKCQSNVAWANAPQANAPRANVS